jgi:hypothetical protein
MSAGLLLTHLGASAQQPLLPCQRLPRPSKTVPTGSASALPTHLKRSAQQPLMPCQRLPRPSKTET